MKINILYDFVVENKQLYKEFMKSRPYLDIDVEAVISKQVYFEKKNKNKNKKKKKHTHTL